MTTARRRLASAVLAVPAVLLATACGNPAGPVPSSGAPASAVPSPAAGPAAAPPTGGAATTTVDRVVLNLGSSSVTIRGADAPGYAVHRTVRGTDAPLADSWRSDGDALVLDGCPLPDCWFDYDVTVPRAVSLIGASGSGAVDASGLAAVSLTSGSGAVRLGDVAGDVRLQTGSGSVQGTGLRGTRTDVTTTSGAVELTTATVQDVRVETTSGAVRVAVAPGRYHVPRGAGSPFRADVPDDTAASSTVDVSSRSGAVAVGLAG